MNTYVIAREAYINGRTTEVVDRIKADSAKLDAGDVVFLNKGTAKTPTIVASFANYRWFANVEALEPRPAETPQPPTEGLDNLGGPNGPDY